MIKFKEAHLFVEKYTNGYLLVDFVKESEFIYFRYNGDYVESMTLGQEYVPTMLLFTNVDALPLKEGNLFTIPMKLLIDIKNDDQNQPYTDEQTMPINIFMIISSKELIKELFKYLNVLKGKRIFRNFEKEVEESWPDGTPCALNQLGPEFVLEVLDVGQGSTNLIYDKNTLTIFDFGVSMGYSEKVCHNILNNISELFKKNQTRSLIISHWDCDHYNLLSVMDDALMRCFCCIFIPSKVISLTAKQVVGRLIRNCSFIRTFKPMPRTKKCNIGILPVIIKNNYVLYVGEQSSSINKSGLALVLKGGSDMAILCADHSNYQIWDCIYPRIFPSDDIKLHIVVPHHGGNCGKIIVKHLNAQAGVAAISVGKNNYKHPQQETIDKYEELNFEVKRTDWERNNIVIKMQ